MCGTEAMNGYFSFGELRPRMPTLNRGFFSAGEEIEKNRRVQLFDLRAGRLKGVKDTEIALPIAMTND